LSVPLATNIGHGCVMISSIKKYREAAKIAA